MAFNVKIFKTRALTAIIFAVVMLAGLLWNKWSFLLLFSFIHFGCWVEYQRLITCIDKGYAGINPLHRNGVMLAGWCFMIWLTGNDYTLFDLQLHELGWWFGLAMFFLLPMSELLFATTISLKNIKWSLLGLLYISLSWGLMMDLYRPGNWQVYDTVYLMDARMIPITIIASIWINGTMAYIVGSFIGKTPLSKISPKKTWEGTIGGIILSVLVVGLLSYYVFHFQYLTIHLVIIAAIAAITGTFGDLLESKLKRMAGVKDSGNFMPGHGGFLDRFDSLLLAIPFVWLYVQLFMN